MLEVCALCGFGYEPGGAACRERRCPLASVSGCRVQHCPRCGYAILDEGGSHLARWIHKLFRGRAPEVDSLATLRLGATATIASLAGDGSLRARLTAHGIGPGTRLTLVQRTPAYVVEIGDTTLAFEADVARGIRLRETLAAGAPLRPALGGLSET